jgi:hypothetical protein
MLAEIAALDLNFQLMPPLGSRSEVVMGLSSGGDQIHFWVNRLQTRTNTHFHTFQRSKKTVEVDEECG